MGMSLLSGLLASTLALLILPTEGTVIFLKHISGLAIPYFDAWAKSSAASMIDLRPLPIPGDLPGPGHCLLLRLSNNRACCPHSPALAPVNLNYLQCQPVSSFLAFAQASPSQNALSNFLPFFGKVLCLF